MNKQKHPFIFNYSTCNNISEYLGTDGLPITETYNLYVKKCEEFKLKARKYAKDNLCTKNSTLHQSKCGYTRSEEFEQQVLLERMELINNYKTAFDITFFYDDPNCMYECFSGKSKTIRIPRELYQERSEEFSSNFDKNKGCWFTRYCILSRFIEAARKIIILNRLTAVLAILKTLTPRMIRKLEGEVESESEEVKPEESEIQILPCVCD